MWRDLRAGNLGNWIILAIGVLLTASGFFNRTYDFPNDTPVKYCFNMDFHNATASTLLAWMPFLTGLGLIAWSVAFALRPRQGHYKVGRAGQRAMPVVAPFELTVEWWAG